MKLRVRNNRMGLGAVFKLVFTGWVFGMGTIFGILFLLMVIVALVSGGIMIDGEMVEGRGVVLLQMLPLLILFPIGIAFQGAIFGAIMVLGLLIYRQFKPIEVISVVEREAADPPPSAGD